MLVLQPPSPRSIRFLLTRVVEHTQRPGTLSQPGPDEPVVSAITPADRDPFSLSG